MTLKYIKSDLYRYTGHISLKTFLKTYLFNRGFNFSFWLRLASSKTVWAKLAYPIYYYKKKQYGIDIHTTTQIGYGLLIEHVKIGNNATIGAGSVVTKDIPENATAVGNYAKVISMNNPGHAVNRRWTDF